MTSLALATRAPRPRSTASVAFANRLRQALRAVPGIARLGWQTRVAKRLRVSSSTVYAWLNGIRYPAVGHLLAISRLTQRSLDWLVTGREWVG